MAMKTKVKNIICYIIGIICISAALALLALSSFRSDTRTFTLITVFVLGFIAVVTMDLIEEPEVVCLISKKRMRRLLNEDKLLPGKYWVKAKNKYIGAIVDLRGDVHLKSFSSKDKMKEWLGRSSIDNVNSSST